MRWDQHVNEKIANANRALGLLRRNIKISSTYIRDLTYKALVRPKLEYAATVWSPWQIYLTDAIEKIQRRAARYVHNDYRLDSSVTTVIHNLNWESLETRRIKASLHMFYKMFNHLASIPYDQYAQLSSATATRHSHHSKLIPISSKKNPLK